MVPWLSPPLLSLASAVLLANCLFIISPMEFRQFSADNFKEFRTYSLLPTCPFFKSWFVNGVFVVAGFGQLFCCQLAAQLQLLLSVAGTMDSRQWAFWLGH